jgi:spermidine synthase
LLLYRPLQDAPYWAHLLRSLFADHPAAFYPYHLAAFLCVLAVIGLPVALSGATLPLIFHQLRRETGELGDVAGRLYSWNTLGSLLGALLGGYALLFWLDLHQVFRVATVALAVGAVLVTRRVMGIASPAATAAMLVPALLALGLLPAWSPDRLSSGPFRHRAPTPSTAEGPTAFFDHINTTSVAFYTDDPTSSVAVREEHDSKGEFHRSIVNNGKSDGDAPSEHLTMAFVSLLPALLAEKAERAFVIGFGTGVTAGEFAALDSAQEVVVAEISPGVIEAAPLFDFANQGASRHPKLRMVRGDAYRTLLRSEGSFDVIASEPSNPWVTGVEMLFSREFLEAARDRLTPGGVFAQWFHIYETDAETVAMVLRTYASVFEHVAVWYAIGADLMLLGLPDPESALDLERLAARVRRPDFAAALRRCGIGGLPQLLAHELLPVGVIDAESLPGELHTLLHPRLSHLAARAFFSGGIGDLPPTTTRDAARRGAANSLLRRLSARRGGRLPEEVRRRLITEVCEYRGNECLTLLAHWAHEVPNSPARQRLLAKIRETPSAARRTKLALLEPLSRLYGTALEVESKQVLSSAQRATQLFSTYYHHAAPFSRELLAQLWRRCESEPSQRLRCLEARADAERTLGRF